MSKKRYAVVGTGGRAANFVERIVKEYPETNEIVGLCDISPTRMQVYNERMQEAGHPAVPMFVADDFGRMLNETKPDAVIVTSVDATHHIYINAALEGGCEVITEKPMTIDAEKCQSVLDTVAKTGGKVRVTFNYRWMSAKTKVKELIANGVIGTVRSVNVDYLLNTSHGADYYRRWHSYLEMCGGLLVHKSTHHFDLVNWWIDSIPEQVFAYGKLAYYGKENAVARGDEQFTGYDRYTGNEWALENDPFALNLKDGGNLEALYYNAEKDSGYKRDQNVFRDGIDIYDTMSVNVRYRNGVLLTYSLNSFAPREGERVCFNGDRGRIEYYAFGGAHIIRGQSEEELAKEQERDKGERKIVVYPHFQDPYEVEIPKPARGGHGGSDASLGDQIFAPNPPDDPWGRNAGHEQGAASIIIGAAANLSIRENRPFNVSDLIRLKPEATRLSELT